MTHHEKTIGLIEELGLRPAKVCQVLSISQSGYSRKKREEQGNKFLESDYTKLFNWAKITIEKLNPA